MAVVCDVAPVRQLRIDGFGTIGLRLRCKCFLGGRGGLLFRSGLSYSWYNAGFGMYPGKCGRAAVACPE